MGTEKKTEEKKVFLDEDRALAREYMMFQGIDKSVLQVIEDTIKELSKVAMHSVEHEVATAEEALKIIGECKSNINMGMEKLFSICEEAILQTFSIQDLRNIVAFFATPSGSLFLNTGKQSAKNISSSMHEWLHEALKPAEQIKVMSELECLLHSISEKLSKKKNPEKDPEKH